MEKNTPPPPRSVAVVGTGMAGLVTAHLLQQDPQQRYQVALLEKVIHHTLLLATYIGFAEVWNMQGSS